MRGRGKKKKEKEEKRDRNDSYIHLITKENKSLFHKASTMLN